MFVHNCPFCDLRSAHIVLESEHSIALKDGFPVNRGHVLVVPRKHVRSLYELSESTRVDLWKMVERVRESLLETLQPDGFNIGVNDGFAAGQTIDHAHIHVIPRWEGDVDDARGGIRWVIPERARYWE